MPTLALVAALLVGLQEQPKVPPQEPPAAPPPAPPLYLEHCARCHGERGDGVGTAELDRPARSFLAGGFSYGNTREAVLRSIRFGIPGTPMPAFPDEVLTLAQRETLADFVIALGPPGTVVEPGASVLRVADRPLVVRGILPPLHRGAALHPRGLLLGFPSGTTFQYRADDVHLLALRQGEFVDRRDWGDRGGQPLRPLGKVIVEASAEEFSLSPGGAPLRRALRATEVRGDVVRIRTALVDEAGTHHGDVLESVRVLDTELGPLPLRTLEVAGAPDLALPASGDAPLEAAFRDDAGAVWHVRRVQEGVFRAARSDPEPGAAATFHFAYAARWSPSLERALTRAEEAAR